MGAPKIVRVSGPPLRLRVPNFSVSAGKVLEAANNTIALELRARLPDMTDWG